MPRGKDSGLIDFEDLYGRVRKRMLAELFIGRAIEHASTAGAEAERVWLKMFKEHLPRRFVARPAFVVDQTGRRSQQIDIAIYDGLHAPVLLTHAAGVHVPVESVYAVFEVKPTFSRQWLREAAAKAESVRKLGRGQRRIMAGLLAGGSVWTAKKFGQNLAAALDEADLDIGCCLEHGSFERAGARVWMSGGQDPLLFFVGRLVKRLVRVAAKTGSDQCQLFNVTTLGDLLLPKRGERGPQAVTQTTGEVDF
jgi:hypothetical protein